MVAAFHYISTPGKLTIHSFLLVVVLIGFNHISTAQQFTATVNKNHVAVGEKFQLTFTLNAKKVGNYRIQGARVKSGGRTFQAKSVSISVTKGAKQNQVTQNKNDLFIRSVLSKNSAYVGESVIVTHYLYTSLNIVSIDNLHLPSYNGFWTETIQRNQIPVANEAINGRNYKRVELSKTILFPHKSGKLTIDAIDVEAVIRRVVQSRSNNIFDNFFRSRYEDNKILTKGKPVSINILPLPGGAPESYKGNVGNYSFDLKVDKTDIKANDAVNFTIQLKGSGNIKLLEVPTIEFPSDFEVYDPKINNKINITENGINGLKSFEYLTIARQPGKFVFKPVEFTFFNPAKKKYVTLKSDEIIINVNKGTGDHLSGSVYTSPNKKDVQFIGKDIRHIKSGDLNLSTDTALFYRSKLFYSLLGGPLALFLSLIAYRRKTISDNE
ncbi:MAG: protein BatD, partial [Bacteroidetes bacterium]|nr:protein BatD [Bacteroidota bacterium]